MNALNLIKGIEAKEERVAQERAKAEEAMIEFGVSLLNERIDELFYDMKFSLGEPTCYYEGGSASQVFVVFVKVKAEAFLPIYVWTTFSMYNQHNNGVFVGDRAPNDHSGVSRKSVDITKPDELGVFLKQRRDGFIVQERSREAERERQEEEVKAIEIRDLSLGLECGAGHNLFYTAPAVAAGALKQLIDLEPARSKEWQGLFNAWWQRYNDIYIPYLVEKEKEARAFLKAKEDYEADKIRYEIEYRRYWEDYHLLMDKNRQKLPGLIARFDEPIPVYEVHFAVVADVQEVEVEIAYCIPGDLSPDYHQQMLFGGKVKCYRFEHIVKTSLVEMIKPSALPGYITGKVRLNQYLGMGYLCYSPLLDKGYVEDEVSQVLEVLPALPKIGLLTDIDAGLIADFIQSGEAESSES